MLESREYEGFWWLPSAPGDRVAGKLVFSQKDVRLELFGSFGASPTETEGDESSCETESPVMLDPFARVADQPRILGVIRDQRAVTLERCLGLGRTINAPGFPITTYGPHVVLDGAWYEPDEEVTFDEISVRFSDLDTWASTSGFAQQMHWDKDGKTVTSLDVKYTPPEAIEVSLDAVTLLRIEFASTWSGWQAVTTESHITQAASLRVCFKNPANIERALTYVPQLRNFLSLAVGRPIRVLSVKGFHSPASDAKPDPFTKLSPRKLEVELLYRLVGLPEPEERSPLPDEMLFTLADAHPRLEAILRAWFGRQEILGPVLTRYFHLVHTPPTSREHEFENLVRVLETHHRRTTGIAGPDAAHERRLDEILNAIPQTHREWLEGKLAYSHEPSLSQRLKEALCRCPKVSARVVGSSRATESFIRKVVVTRNYETHLDRSNQAKTARGAELLTLVYQLRALVEMTLLLEIGFTCDDVDAVFNRATQRYSRVDHLRGPTT